jgi:hypothetical protein
LYFGLLWVRRFSEGTYAFADAALGRVLAEGRLPKWSVSESSSRKSWRFDWSTIPGFKLMVDGNGILSIK